MATSSTDFGVLVYVVGFLDPSTNDPISCTNMLPSPNSNGNPFVDLGLLIGTCTYNGLNTAKEGCVSILFVYNPIACRPSCVCCYCCCKCYCKCWKCCGLIVVSIQSSYTFPSKCRCSSPFKNLVSCSPLTSCLYSLSSFSRGNVICGIFIVYLVACTTIGTVNGSILPLIIFCALTFVLSCSFFTFEPKVPPSSTLFFLLRALLGESVAAFFLFFNVVCISSLVLLTLVDGFYGFSF